MNKSIIVLADSKQAKKLGPAVVRASTDMEKSVDLAFAHKDYDYITVVKDKPKTSQESRDLGGDMYTKYKDRAVSIEFDEDLGHITEVNEGAAMASYTFDKYKTDGKISKLQVGKDAGIASSVAFARDLVSEPGNVLYPTTYAARISRKLAGLGVNVKVYHETQLREMGLNLLLSVGQGSECDSYVVVMEYMNGKPNDRPVALVGKGVTFDTGGISIKPSRGMGDMKFDMGGSAAVVGALHAIASQQIKQNVVGIVGLVENMPDGKSIKPGDVVTSLSGKSVENLNTDAEGRLVLADILTLVQNQYNPDTIIDLATLTGAIVGTLGHEMAGLFTNSTPLQQAIEASGKESGEGYFRMPMGPVWNKMIDSDIADMQNIGGPYGGSTTAAEFLYRFVDSNTAWAHLDIAGMAWEEGSKSTCPKGATGFGVRTLYQFVAARADVKVFSVDKNMDY
jgi:leucyl aminopeptidase